MSTLETDDGALSVGNSLAMIGTRKIEPCSCGKENCACTGMAVEVSALVDPVLVKHIVDDGHDEDHPFVFPVFITADEARTLAVKLMQLADEADPKN